MLKYLKQKAAPIIASLAIGFFSQYSDKASAESQLTDKEILGRIEQVIRRNSTSLLQCNTPLYLSRKNYDLNNDCKIDPKDQLIMRNLHNPKAVPYHLFSDSFTKIRDDVRSRINRKTGDPAYVPEYDLDGDGEIEMSDFYQIRYALPGPRFHIPDQGQILMDLEKVVRDNQLLQCNTPRYNPNWDFNDDCKITSSEQLRIRSICSQPDEVFSQVYEKMTTDVSQRLGAERHESDYIREYDVNNNGYIDRQDAYLISDTLLCDRK